MPIIQSITKFLQTVQIPFTIVANVSRQKIFIKKNIMLQLTVAQKMADGSLDENDFKKITCYYGLAVPAVLGEAFCALRGEPMTDKERMASTCQGAMTGLGDDFFDRQRLSEAGVKDFIERPDMFNGNTASEKLFLNFYKTALANAPQPTLMQQQIYKVFYAQLLSKQQDAPGLSYEVMKDITILKGAESLLYYRSALGYQFFAKGVSTLVTTATKIKALRFYYTALLQVGTRAAFKSGYKKNYVKKFLGIINLGIFSRCYVCLDQLEGLEKKSIGIFDLKTYSRKDLICDMDTAGNKCRSLGYLFKLSRKYR